MSLASHGWNRNQQNIFILDLQGRFIIEILLLIISSDFLLGAHSEIQNFLYVESHCYTSFRMTPNKLVHYQMENRIENHVKTMKPR